MGGLGGQDVTAPPGRGQFASRLGFVLAAAGSAIGLGNMWRFPVEAANNGGAAFLLVYLGFVLLLGLPVMLAEMSLGRHTGRNPVGAIRAACPRGLWWLVGALGVLTGLCILSYYSVVAGWTVGYTVKALGHTFTPEMDPAAEFGAFAGSWWQQLGLHAVFMLASVAVVLGGIKNGIERWSKILMPTLLVVMLLLILRSVSLPGAARGLGFYLNPDFSKLDMKVVVAALGQAFFSLSLGMGAMITYGSYLSRKENLVSSAAWVAGMDTAIAFMAGLLILPALAMAGLTPGVDQGGPGLIFTVLPKVFVEMPWSPWGGILFGGFFFLLLLVAALTSSISLLEVVTAYLVDERRWSRRRATWTVGGLAFGLGVPSALSLGAVGWLTAMTTLPDGSSLGFLDLMDKVFGKLTLTFGALLICVVVGWVWGIGKAREEIAFGNARFRVLGKVWSVLVRYVCPLAVAAVLAALVFDPHAIR
jgi:NSS family neurotransmitter:Na+ symporter